MSTETTAGPVVGTLDALLRLLRDDEPGRPRLTWYGAAGERVELSGRVLDNWVAKTANLLVDELDVGPGSRVLVHLPVHWRTATWLLAIWASGAAAVAPAGHAEHDAGGAGIDPGSVGPVDVVVSDRPHLVADVVADGAQLVVQPLPALARRWTAELPPGALDATGEVRGQGDVFVASAAPAGSDPALVVPRGDPHGTVTHGGLTDGTVTHGGLFKAARLALAGAGWPVRPRLLVEVGPGPGSTDAGSADPVRWLLAPLAANGSVVILGEQEPGAPSPAAQEGVTAHW